MEILIHQSAEKTLDKLLPETREKIKDSLKKLIEDPYSKKLDIKKLKGLGSRPDLFRLRVGDYRIIYAIKEKSIMITDIIKREQGYRL
jgi:mRNA interferase RelE/StbE